MQIFDYQKMVRTIPVLQELVKIGLIVQDSIRIYKTGQREICFEVSGGDDAMDFIGKYLEEKNLQVTKDYWAGMITILCLKHIDIDNDKEREKLCKYIDDQLI